MPTINPTRFEVARKRRGLTMKALAELADVTDRTIRSMEKNRYETTEPTLRVLSEALGFPASFLTSSEDLELTRPASASFRSLRRMTRRECHSVLAAAALASKLSELIDESFELPELDLPNVDGSDPESAARATREAWNLGERPIRNMVHLLEAKGVRVFSLDREHSSVDAFTTWRGSEPFVFLNTLKAGERGRFDAAHELGHVILHRHGIPQGDHLEDQANRFAAAFLLPDAQMRAIAPRSPSVGRLLAIKRKWGVSIGAIARRLHGLGLMSDWHYRQVYIELNRQGGRSREPASVQRETSSLLRQVFAAWREDGISRGEIAKRLHLRATDLSALVFGLVPTDVAGGRQEPAKPTGKLSLVE